MAAILFIIGSSADASQVDDWLQKLDNPNYKIDRLQPANLADKYSKYDFAKLLIPRSQFLGYIGDNYQRLFIYLNLISRDPIDKKKYHVHGASEVRGDKRSFDGEIVVTTIREYLEMHYGVDDEMKPAGIKREGLLVGRYNFKQQDNQTPGGTFEGIVTLYWYVDRKGNIRYDDIEHESDNYINNQYVGTWIASDSNEKEVANWGEYRIPFSGDLDIGAAEFSADPKYKAEGWDDN